MSTSKFGILMMLALAEIRGGCESCDAYQTVGNVDDGVVTITVHHDDDCPRLKHHRESAGTP